MWKKTSYIFISISCIYSPLLFFYTLVYIVIPCSVGLKSIHDKFTGYKAYLLCNPALQELSDTEWYCLLSYLWKLLFPALKKRNTDASSY